MTLKEIRELTGLTATNFAKKYKIPQSTYSKWELPKDNSNARDCPDYTKDLLEQAVLWEYKGSKRLSALESENICLWEIIEQNGLARKAHNLINDRASQQRMES